MIKCFINDNHENWDLVYKTPNLNLKFDPNGYAEFIKHKFTKMYETVRKNREVRVLKNKVIYDGQIMAAKFKECDAVWLKNEQVKKENTEDMNESQVEQTRKKLSHQKFSTTRSKRAKEKVERAKTLLRNRIITSPNELIEGDTNSDNQFIDVQNVD
ncbi:unnamed protein product [Brachionus calyciflorus]|uniref:Uncharacterized protein n=1 Tax=Brachionus calyciflorus TaxID=104777 RepID=A0A814CMR2_9BILA|nr:unnamed protein product [Brachionus calyciflorus]